MKRLLTIFCLILGIAISYSQLPVNYSSQLVQQNYAQPMGTLFNSDGTKMFVWTYSGQIFVSNWDGSQYVKQNTPVLDISEEVLAWRDFGLLGVALDPNFDTNGLIYMFYAVDRLYATNPDYNPLPAHSDRATISRLTRYQLNHQAVPMTTNYASRFVLLGETLSTGIPLLYESHAGGSLAFGSDGTLMVTTGDNASYSTTDVGSVGHTYYQQAINEGLMRSAENVGAMRSQMVNSLCGKVLRLDPATGNGVPSNPFYDNANPRSAPSRMWAMGFRNPFRMSIKPNSGSTNPADANPGTLFVVDVGWNTWEDLHILDKPGLNAGWPLYEGQTQLNSYFNSGATNPDENNQLFRDLCVQPSSFLDDANPALRRFVHNRPEVTWRHGSDDARVPWFNGTTPTDPRVGTVGSPTTGVQFRGNTGVSGVFLDNCGLGPNYNGKYFFTDYVRNFINVATLNDGSQNWISDIEQFAPANFGSGIVHMVQNPNDGSIFYTNIFNGHIRRISFGIPANPTWTVEPTDLTVECSANNASNFDNWKNSFSGVDECTEVAIVTNNSSVLSDTCGNTGSETVTFTLKTINGTSITKAATFTITDTTDPTFNETLPADATVQCDAIPTAPTLTASDSCGSASVSYSEAASGNCSDGNFITRTWTATDDCGNDTIHTQTLTVIDTVDPTFNESLPSDATVQCNAIPTAPTLTASDSCGSASVSYSEVTSGNCSDGNFITRTWTATDDCGNDTIHTQTLTVIDTVDPTFNESLPADATVQCNAIPTAPTLTASDSCGSASVSYSQIASGNCTDGNFITKTWTATDDCGNDTIHTQTLTVIDTVDPTFNESLPSDATVQCNAIPTAPTLTASDSCGSASVSYSEVTSGNCTDGNFITRTWTATDDCGNDTIHTQTLTVIDTVDPTFNETLPADATVQCNAIPTAPTLTASDSCGSASVSYSEVASGNCTDGNFITRTWTATDDCGNDTIHTQTLTIIDTVDPTFNESLPTDATVQCNAIPTAPTLTASDSCGSASVSYSEVTSGNCSDGNFITRTWTATDACGNDTVQTQTLTVMDSTNPSWTNIPTDLTIECSVTANDEFLQWLSSFSGTDNCGATVLSHNSAGTLNACGALEAVIFSLTDECGNTITQTATFTIDDTLGTIDAEKEHIRIYPNPSFDFVIVEGLQSKAMIAIYNLAGQKVLEKEVLNEQPLYFNLASGLYLLKIDSGLSTINKKLIVE